MSSQDPPLLELDIRRAAGAAANNCAIHVLQEASSTNSWLQQHGEEGRISLCIAEQQVQGKGRRGRQWQSESGGFTCSIRLPLSVPLLQAGAFSLVVAMSLREALAKQGVLGVGAKWPNDLLHDWRKLSGVLLEVARSDKNSVDLICGAGVNWRPMQQTVDQPLTDVYTLTAGVPQDRNRLAGAWLATMLVAKARFERHGFDSFAAEWQACDLLHDASVVVLRGEQRLQGIARGVDAEGALRLETEQGMQLLHAGEVSLRRQ